MKNKSVTSKSALKQDKASSTFKNNNKISFIKNSDKANERSWREKQVSNKPDKNGSSNFFIIPNRENKNQNDGVLNKEKPMQHIHNKSNRKKHELPFSEDEHKQKKQDKEINKKKFNKRKWYLQKYSKKYKLEQWEEKRKRSLLREYYKQTQKDEPKFDVEKIYEKYANEDNAELEQSRSHYIEDVNIKKDLNKVDGSVTNVENRKEEKDKIKHLQWQQLKSKEEKNKAKEEILKKTTEREADLKAYKKKKWDTHKKLSKKTRKGQPIMKYRMEMLLEQIEKNLK